MLDGRLPTVALRMNRQSKNAGRPQTKRVIYPTLFEDAEQNRIRAAQCDYPGGMFSLDLHGGREAAFSFLRNLKITRNAVSKTTTHSGMKPEEPNKLGSAMGWCACRWASRIGVTCYQILNRRRGMSADNAIRRVAVTNQPTVIVLMSFIQ
jgi:hypothetical protein